MFDSDGCAQNDTVVVIFYYLYSIVNNNKSPSRTKTVSIASHLDGVRTARRAARVTTVAVSCRRGCTRRFSYDLASGRRPLLDRDGVVRNPKEIKFIHHVRVLAVERASEPADYRRLPDGDGGVSDSPDQ